MICLLQRHDNINEYFLKLWLIFLCTIVEFSFQFILYLHHEFPGLDEDKLGQIAIIIFSVLGLYYIIISVSVIIETIQLRDFHMIFKSNREYQAKIISQVLVALAGLLYYFGDNFSYYIEAYGDIFDCDSSCTDAVEYAANGMLYMSLLLFTLIPLLIERVTIVGKSEVNYTEKWHWAVARDTGHAFALIVDLDAWFTAIASVPFNSPDFCPSGEIVLAWIMYGLSLFIWAVVLVLIYAPGIYLALYQTTKNIKKVILYIFLIVLLWTTTATIILTDNPQPIGCLFGCDIATNIPNGTVCRIEQFHYTRSIMLGVAVIVLAIVVTITTSLRVGTMLIFNINKKKGSAVKKKANYTFSNLQCCKQT